MPARTWQHMYSTEFQFLSSNHVSNIKPQFWLVWFWPDHFFGDLMEFMIDIFKNCVHA